MDDPKGPSTDRLTVRVTHRLKRLIIGAHETGEGARTQLAEAISSVGAFPINTLQPVIPHCHGGAGCRASVHVIDFEDNTGEATNHALDLILAALTTLGIDVEVRYEQPSQSLNPGDLVQIIRPGVDNPPAFEARVTEMVRVEEASGIYFGYRPVDQTLNGGLTWWPKFPVNSSDSVLVLSRAL